MIPFDMTQVTSVANRQRLEAGREAPSLHAAGGAHVIQGYRMQAFGEYADDDTASALKQRDYKDATDLIAYQCHGTNVGEMGTLRQGNGAVTGGVPFMAFQQNQRDEVRDLGDVAGALPAQPGMKQQNYIAVRTANTSANGHGVADDVAHTLDGANGQAIAFTNRGLETGTSAERLRAGSHGALPMVAATLTSNGDAQNGHRDEHGLIAFDWTQSGGNAEDISPTLRVGTTGMGTSAVSAMAVRRLTPTECERLMGLPDGWTAVDGAADSTRYRQLGNAVAVPVAEWIARRIVAASE